MEGLIDWKAIEATLAAAETWLFREVLVVGTLVQALIIAVAFVLARLLAPRTERWIARLGNRPYVEVRFRRLVKAISTVTLPVLWLLLQWIASLVAAAANWPHHLITVVTSLLAAWIIIRLTSSVVREPAWSRFVALSAWTVAALNIVELLDPAIAMLDGLAVTLGDLRISALTVLKGVLALAFLLWLATATSRLLERRISKLPSLTPSIQVLFSKLLKIVLITIAIVAALSSVGIDLTAFAVFSGAIGVGIGFGLQKVVANLISGVILLLDKSVKPGDVIAVGETYGWISSLGARYVSVVTRDGIEHLIPNEELIILRVENWSFSNNQVRLKIPIGISYNSDVRRAMELCLAAAAETPRVLKEPKTVCLLKGFGDSSVDLELRIWINDPSNGVSNVKSAVLLSVWDKFHEHGVEIPFPQRDLHIKSAVPLLASVDGQGRDAGGVTSPQAAEASTRLRSEP